MIWTEIKLARNPSYFGGNQEGYFSEPCKKNYPSGNFVEKASERLKTIFFNTQDFRNLNQNELEMKSVVKGIFSKFLYIDLRIFK